MPAPHQLLIALHEGGEVVLQLLEGLGDRGHAAGGHPDLRPQAHQALELLLWVFGGLGGGGEQPVVIMTAWDCLSLERMSSTKCKILACYDITQR